MWKFPKHWKRSSETTNLLEDELNFFYGWFVCQFAIWSLGFLGDSFVIAEASMFAVLDGRAGLLDDCFQ